MLRYTRYSVRGLVRSPRFTVTALLTMGLGIGANVAMFSVLNAVLLRPLPYRDPDRVVQLWETKKLLKSDRITVAAPNYQDWRDGNHVFEGMAFVKGASFYLAGPGSVQKVQALSVSANFFRLLGTAPEIGRTFAAQEGEDGATPVLVLSHRLWENEFGGNPDIVGRSVALDGRAYTVIGVTRADFYFPEFGRKWDLWTPLALSEGERTSRDAHVGGAVARLKTGVTLDRAQRELDGIATRLEQQFLSTNSGAGVRLVPIAEQAAGAIRPTLIVLFGAVGLVLLMACSNVANLLLVRAAAREKEMGVRIALGAGLRDLVLQLLTESAVLAGLGGLGGVLLAWTLLPLVRLVPVNIPRIDQVAINGSVLVFSALATLLCGLLFGLAPAVQLARRDIGATLGDAGRSSAARGSRHTRFVLGALVVAETMLAFILLTGAGLLIESLHRVVGVDAGFRSQNVLTATISLPEKVYAGSQSLQFQGRLLDQVRRLPQVSAAGLTTNLPIAGRGWSTYFSIEGRTLTAGEVLAGEQRLVSPGYFESMGIPLVSGRRIRDEDTPSALPVAVVNDVLAKRYFAATSPIGHRVKWGRENDGDYPLWFTSVGVVGSVRHRALESPASPELYMCAQQMAGGLAAFAPTEFSLVVRSTAGLVPLTGAVGAVLSSLDRQVRVADVRTMDQVLSRSLAPREFNVALFGVFAALALTLAWVGTYGVIAHVTELRTHEIGIRIALGSDQWGILRLVLGEGMRLTTIGVGLGFAGAWFLTRTLASLLYGVGPHSPEVLLGSAVTVSAAALVASYLPARRAAATDPAIVLR